MASPFSADRSAGGDVISYRTATQRAQRNESEFRCPLTAKVECHYYSCTSTRSIDSRNYTLYSDKNYIVLFEPQDQQVFLSLADVHHTAKTSRTRGILPTTPRTISSTLYNSTQVHKATRPNIPLAWILQYSPYNGRTTPTTTTST